jgi:translation initiation factor IF-3
MTGFKVRINGDLRGTPQVQLIDLDGSMVGVLTLAEALRAAMKAGVDLVEVNPASNPPTCKLLDFDKFRASSRKRDE